MYTLTKFSELGLHAVAEEGEGPLLELDGVGGGAAGPGEVWLGEVAEVLHHVLVALVGGQQPALVLETPRHQVQVVAVLLLLAVPQRLRQNSVLPDKNFAVTPMLADCFQFVVSHIFALKYKYPALIQINHFESTFTITY